MLNLIRNPNTKVVSIGVILSGYFGVGKDGYKLADSETVFPVEQCEKVGQIPAEAKATLQKQENNNGEKKDDRDELGRFKAGIKPTGRPAGVKNKSKTPITDLVKELLLKKKYKLKGSNDMVLALDVIAEKMLDRAVEGDFRYFDMLIDRVEGKVTQGVKMTAVVARGEPEPEEWSRLMSLFPEK